MIHFACKKFNLEEVLRCAFGLTKTEFKIIKFLLKYDEDYFNTKDLSKKLKLDITTIQRAMKKIHEKDLVIRTQENFDGGGYVFYYQVKDKKDIKNKAIDIIHKWAKVFEREIESW